MWIPVSLNASDGALFIDAGKLKMAVVKPSKTSSTRWGIDLSDIQIKFSREDTSTQQFDISLDLDAVNSLNKEFIIVRPFYIGMSGIMTESVEIPLKVVFPSDSISAAAEISIVVGKVCLNLVDVEGERILAFSQPRVMISIDFLHLIRTCQSIRAFLCCANNSS